MEHLYFVITHKVSEDILDSQYSRKGKRRKLKGTAVGLKDKLKPARLGTSSMDIDPGNKPGYAGTSISENHIRVREGG